MTYTCDDCGKEFELGPGTYLGSPTGEGNDRCNPFLAMTALCEECYGTMQEGEEECG